MNPNTGTTRIIKRQNRFRICLTDSLVETKQYRQRSKWAELKHKNDGNYDKLPSEEKN
jgi:hypothetical protein